MPFSSPMLRVAMPPTSIKPTNKKPVHIKRRRPQFRPASQRKSVVAKDVSPPATPAAAVASPSQEENVQEDNTLTESPPIITRRSNKKRKSTTGVAIGSSRLETTNPELLGETTPSNQTVVLAEPQVPDAEPGQDALKSFCSRYRTKEKRAKAQKANAPAKQQQQQQQQPPAQHAPAETSAASSSAGPVVQVVNGEIVLQESSVVVPGARRSVQEVEAEFGQEVVEEEAQHSAVIGASYNSFVTRRAPQHWSVVETKMFYKYLRMVGTDFATMAAFFENRTRKQLKRKYQVENSKNPHLIELALSPQARIPLGMSSFHEIYHVNIYLLFLGAILTCCVSGCVFISIDMSVFDVTVDASSSNNTETTGTAATQQETEQTTPAVASQSGTQGETVAAGGINEAKEDDAEEAHEEATSGPSLVAQLEEQVQTQQESATTNEEEKEVEPIPAVWTKPRARPKARRTPKFRASRRKAKS